MDDHRLKSYCLVVELKSFSRAAHAKHITQSAMSRLVKGLEDELGVTLLLRRGKTVAPTAEGRLFYEHAQKILGEYRLLEESIGLVQHAAKNVLRLGAAGTPARHLLPQALYDFSKAHPEIRLDLTVSDTAGVLRDLGDGKIDLGIVEGADDAEYPYPADALAQGEIIVIAPENHPLAKKKNVLLRDVAAEPLIFPDRASGMRDLIDGLFRDNGTDPKGLLVRMTLGSPELIVQMTQAGIGIGFAPKWAVFTAIKERSVKVLHVPGKTMRRRVCLLSRDKGALTTAAAAFREFLRTYRFFFPL